MIYIQFDLTELKECVAEATHSKYSVLHIKADHALTSTSGIHSEVKYPGCSRDTP